MFPQWDSPTEWPWAVNLMVSEARRILSYFQWPENIRPPQSLWHSARKSAKWIEDHQPGKDKSGETLDFIDGEIERAT